MTARRRARIAVIVGVCVVIAAGWALRASRAAEAKRKRRAIALVRAATRAKKKAALLSAGSPVPRSRPILTAEEARQARAAAIRAAIGSIRSECQAAAGGDWDRWIAQLEPLRAEMRTKIAAGKPFNPSAPGSFENRSPVLAGKDGFPLFEPSPDGYLRHAYDPALLDVFRRSRWVIEGDRWLRQKGIDVIFVAVPKMTEVYPDRIFDRCPPDRIIAPQILRIFLELLEEDVEVVDFLGVLQQARDSDAEPLYLPADPHWAPRAQAIAARILADRLSRYDFVARAQSGPSYCEWYQAPYLPVTQGAAFLALNPDQQRRAIEVQPKTYLLPRNGTRSFEPNRLDPTWDDHSPVACIGDSYNVHFMEQLSHQLNLPIRNMSGGGQSTQAFKQFLRDPQALDGCKVVIWLVCYPNLQMQPMPQPILDAVHGKAVAKVSAPEAKRP